MRDRAGYTLTRFAAELGVNVTYLSRIERGLQQPGIVLRNRIAAKLGVDLDDIAHLPDNASTAA
jgi:transcriptional regulator with XRE-family HTH domain